jgi:RNA polymerase sigma-70 factor, ECF subfamily
MVKRFEEAMLPHLAAAYNLARWLTRNDADADDLVQDAYLRALKAFDGFRGDNGRAWLLRIVRNTCYTWLQENRVQELATTFDEELYPVENDSTNPETLLLRSADKQFLKEALEKLPLEFREVIVLRELEGMSYKEIAELAAIPVGTVRDVPSGPRSRAPSTTINPFGRGALT